MTDPRITEEAVEAATRALARTFVTNKPVAGSKDFRVDARAALEAARPYFAPQPIDREALEELRQYCEEQAEGPVVNDLGEGKLIAYADLADRLAAVLALINGSAS